ncbi:hypothetical protein EJ06DRAFT_403211 [Trichodelitschia bisporula]|uniref:HRQ family protein n=1 Tax=Trichodelitschia bisporula TaxID=703511 RepID=A0A6G1HY25_9PEZI|nr:hypothetical protein EJ06DRAFT_403211 [Trichodelitschia bisporula]
MFPDSMALLILLALGGLFVASWTLFLISKSHKQVLMRRLRLPRRRNSGANTPPRKLSLTPTIKLAASDPNYREVFPPSRRHILTSEPHDDSKILLRALPMTKPFDQADGSEYTPTGFTVNEIRGMGNFPDYAKLSGVPLPQPYWEFDMKKALPRPYRPFRWAYHQTMALKKLEPDWWIELENTYVERIRQRQALLAQYGELVLNYLPGSELACRELMEMALQFLVARYPHYFELDVKAMKFRNKILNTTSDLNVEHPLVVMTNNVPEDFAIMLRDPETGLYHFRAGAICSALGWNIGTKLGMTLGEIHQPIPDYKEKMQFSMDRYFAKKPTDKAIQRGSWGFEVDQPLFMPPGDPHEKHRDVQDENLDPSRVHLRVDWQTLRRLPLSGAVVFNFKALFTPLEYIHDEPYVPSLVLKVLREGSREIMKYKNTWHTEHRAIPMLESFDREQRARGIVERDWEAHTLDESPFYPGWEAKWHRDQGF